MNLEQLITKAINAGQLFLQAQGQYKYKNNSHLAMLKQDYHNAVLAIPSEQRGTAKDKILNAIKGVK